MDRGVYRLERNFVVFALLAMAIVVFLDVVHRAFSGDTSKVVEAVAKVAGWFGAESLPGTPGFERLGGIVPPVLFVVFVVLAQFGIRTATRSRPVPHGRAWIYAIAGVVATYGLAKLLVLVVPNGIIWSQPFALVLTLWVGFFGASMATHENKHLKVEAVQRHIPLSLRKWVAFASAVATALFCLALLWLSIRYVRFNYDEYRSTEGQGGLVQGLDMPKWIAYLALPISFAVMTARFFGVGAAALAGRIEEGDPLAGLVDDATKAALEAQLKPQSDIPTEAIKAVADGGPLSSTRMRQSGAAPEESGRRRKPSEVVTDRHDIAPPASDPGEDGE